MANQIITFVSSTGAAPSYVNTTKGKIRYESVIYSYSRIMSYYSSHKRLPSTVQVKAWSWKVQSEGYKVISNPSKTCKAYNIVVTPQYVKATAKCSCGRGTYTYETHTFLNYCPQCHHYGTLSYIKPCAEGQWTCRYCDCDYCMQCGKEKMVKTKLWLKAD